MHAKVQAAAPGPAPVKPRLSFWAIWNMSFGFLGIQAGFALQQSNVPRWPACWCSRSSAT
jgi:maltose/moltooligosaccharide transporter